MIQEQNGSNWQICAYCPCPIERASHRKARYLDRQKLIGPFACSPIDCQLPHSNQYEQHPQPFHLDVPCSNTQYKNVQTKQERADSQRQHQILSGSLPNEPEFVEILQRV